MLPPADLDRLAHTELKSLVVKQWEELAELRRLVATLRDDEYQTERYGQGDRAEAGTARRRAAEGRRQNGEACDPRRADHQGEGAARLALQRLYELHCAGPDDPLARRAFSLRALADPGRRHDDGAVAGRYSWSLWTRTAPLRAHPISSGAGHGAAAGGAVAGTRPLHL